MTVDLSPASQKLLLELARQDEGEGVAVRYSSRGRWYLAGASSSNLFNTRTFPPLYDAGLATGWDEHDADGPMRITEAGRNLAAELVEQDKARRVAKEARSKPNPDGQAALRLLREIANRGEPTPIFCTDRDRRIWRLGARDGYSARADTWLALSGAGRIHIEYGFSGGKQVSATDAGRTYLAEHGR